MCVRCRNHTNYNRQKTIFSRDDNCRPVYLVTVGEAHWANPKVQPYIFTTRPQRFLLNCGHVKSFFVMSPTSAQTHIKPRIYEVVDNEPSASQTLPKKSRHWISHSYNTPAWFTQHENSICACARLASVSSQHKRDPQPMQQYWNISRWGFSGHQTLPNLCMIN